MPLHISTRSSSSCRISIVVTTDLLGIITPPFLSKFGLRGQLKSPRIIMFSSSSKLFFRKVMSRFLRKLLIFVSLLGGININQNIHFIVNLSPGHTVPRGQKFWSGLCNQHHILKRIATPHELELPWAIKWKEPYFPVMLESPITNFHYILSCLS